MQREPWPLYVETFPGEMFDGETLEVFTDQGDLTPEFLEAIEGSGNE